METILQEIRQERQRQVNKWGIQNHTPIEWMAILMEEVGEASKEALDIHFAYPPKGAKEFDLEQVQAARQLRYREELVQVAAVAVAMLESFDRASSAQ